MVEKDETRMAEQMMIMKIETMMAVEKRLEVDVMAVKERV